MDELKDIIEKLKKDIIYRDITCRDLVEYMVNHSLRGKTYDQIYKSCLKKIQEADDIVVKQSNESERTPQTEVQLITNEQEPVYDEFFKKTLHKAIEKLKAKEKGREIRSSDVLMYVLTDSKLDLVTKQQVIHWCNFRIKYNDVIVPGDPNMPSKNTYIV